MKRNFCIYDKLSLVKIVFEENYMCVLINKIATSRLVVNYDIINLCSQILISHVSPILCSPVCLSCLGHVTTSCTCKICSSRFSQGATMQTLSLVACAHPHTAQCVLLLYMSWIIPRVQLHYEGSARETVKGIL